MGRCHHHSSPHTESMWGKSRDVAAQIAAAVADAQRIGTDLGNHKVDLYVDAQIHLRGGERRDVVCDRWKSGNSLPAQSTITSLAARRDLCPTCFNGDSSHLRRADHLNANPLLFWLTIQNLTTQLTGGPPKTDLHTLAQLDEDLHNLEAGLEAWKRDAYASTGNFMKWKGIGLAAQETLRRGNKKLSENLRTPEVRGRLEEEYGKIFQRQVHKILGERTLIVWSGNRYEMRNRVSQYDRLAIAAWKETGYGGLQLGIYPSAVAGELIVRHSGGIYTHTPLHEDVDDETLRTALQLWGEAEQGALTALPAAIDAARMLRV